MRGLWIPLLIAFGFSADAAAADSGSVEAFHHAVHIGDVETARTMLAGDAALAIAADEYRFQPIHLLDMYFEPEILDLLLANGADINAGNDEGVTLLHIVTEPDAVAVLVERGADINARDARGWTPLVMQAANQQNGPDVVAAFLAHGADPNARGKGGETALAFARQTGEGAFIKILIDSGARD